MLATKRHHQEVAAFLQTSPHLYCGDAFVRHVLAALLHAGMHQVLRCLLSWCACALQVTYSSDYFEQLYQLSIQLIKGGHAYVDHQTAEQVKLSRYILLALWKLFWVLFTALANLAKLGSPQYCVSQTVLICC